MNDKEKDVSSGIRDSRPNVARHWQSYFCHSFHRKQEQFAFLSAYLTHPMRMLKNNRSGHWEISLLIPQNVETISSARGS